MKPYIGSVAAMAVLYVIQFIFAPLLFPRFFPRSNEAYAIFAVTLLIVTAIGFWKINDKLLPWVCADIVYFVLILIYPGKGAYGIGMRGIDLDGVTASFSRDVVFLGALLALAAVVLIHMITKAACSLIQNIAAK